MVECPLANDARRLLGQRAGYNLAGVDGHKRLEALVGRVEVRRRMIVEIHPDDDAEEDGDDGH